MCFCRKNGIKLALYINEGFNRLLQIIAVLEKRIGINLSKHDVYVNVIVNDTNHFGFVIDETSNTLVCLMNEDAQCNKDITGKTPEDVWEILGIQNGNVVGTTVYALDYSQVDKITSSINSSLSAYRQEKGISIVHITTNLAMNGYLATYINSFGEEQVSVTDSANTIILAYIAISATN